MRVFKNRVFARFAQQNGIEDGHLCDAIRRAERGLIDADLGGGVIKQRIARPGKGRSGGFRTIILFRTEERAFFVYGFAKNQKENIHDIQLQNFRMLAKDMLVFSEAQLDLAVKTQKLIEVNYNDEDIQG
jgi:hypothetical protein